MPIIFPKVLRRLELVDHGPDYAGMWLEVWVNPPREMRERYWKLLAEAAVISEKLSKKNLFTTKDTKEHEGKTIDEGRTTEEEGRRTEDEGRKGLVERANEVGREVTLWLSEMLSQGEADCRCTPESLQELADQSPRFYQWIMENVYRLIQEYRMDKKKG